MATLPTRYRSSTSASTSANTNPKYVQVLQTLLDDLIHEQTSRTGDGYPDIPKLAKGLRNLAQLIAAPPASMNQDAFRLAGGFECCLTCCVALRATMIRGSGARLR